jgi:hypothetical protein
VVLTVSDTGIGMSPEFLANHLYSPFTQENSFSSGVGLGLNIVRQIVESISGNIDLTSDRNVGTEVTVTYFLPSPEDTATPSSDREMLTNVANRMMGRSVCILNTAVTPGANPSSYQSGPSILGSTLTSTLEGWLGISVVTTSTLNEPHGADIVICAEPSFEYLTSIREKASKSPNSKAPITIFLAIDAIEAAALRTDVRVTSKESVVEIIIQP